jgi:hypothetical protein
VVQSALRLATYLLCANQSESMFPIISGCRHVSRDATCRQQGASFLNKRLLVAKCRRVLTRRIGLRFPS